MSTSKALAVSFCASVESFGSRGASAVFCDGASFTSCFWSVVSAGCSLSDERPSASCSCASSRAGTATSAEGTSASASSLCTMSPSSEAMSVSVCCNPCRQPPSVTASAVNSRMIMVFLLIATYVEYDTYSKVCAHCWNRATPPVPNFASDRTTSSIVFSRSSFVFEKNLSA